MLHRNIHRSAPNAPLKLEHWAIEDVNVKALWFLYTIVLKYVYLKWSVRAYLFLTDVFLKVKNERADGSNEKGSV